MNDEEPNCKSYRFPSECENANYTTPTFNPMEMCCVCGGGAKMVDKKVKGY